MLAQQRIDGVCLNTLQTNCPLRDLLLDTPLARWLSIDGLTFDQSNVLDRQLARLTLTLTRTLTGAQTQDARPS